MTHPLIDALLADDGAHAMTADGLETYLKDGASQVSALFFTGDPEKKLETADVAVVLRELLRENPDQLRVAVIDQRDERDLMHRCGVIVLPSVSFYGGGMHLETIAKIQDWSVYAEKLAALFEKARAIPA